MLIRVLMSMLLLRTSLHPVVNEPFILMPVVMLVSSKNQVLLLVLQNIQCFIVYTFLFISFFFLVQKGGKNERDSASS